MIEAFVLDVMNSLLTKPGERLSLYALDSTPIDSHKVNNWTTTLRRQSHAGFTHEGVFFSFKLHVLCLMESDVVAVDLSAGNIHEVSPVRGIRLSGIQGMVLGDSGYVSRRVHELRRRDLTLIAKPRPEMTDEL